MRTRNSGGSLATPSAVRAPIVPASLRDRWLLIILAVATAVRVQAGMRSRLWFDEIYTLWIARRPLPDLLRSVAGDIHPPLHYLLVSAWRSWGGENDLYLKTLSIIAGVATIWLVYCMGRDFFSRSTGLAAAGLLALHPAHVAFSQESRSYALLFLLLATSQWCAWCWIQRRAAQYGIGFVLAATAALYTHYLAAPVLACTALWGMWALRRESARVRSWVGLYAIVTVLFAPQVPTVIIQLARLRADRWVKPPTAAGLLNLMRLLAFSRAAAIVPLIGLSALPLLGLGTMPLFRHAQWRAAALLWMSSLIPAVLIWAMAMCGAGVFIERYMLFGLPAWCVLLAAGATGWRAPWLRFVSLAILLIIAARGVLLHRPQHEAERLTKLESYLGSHVRSGDVVVHADAHSLLFSRHYPLDPGEHLIYLRTPGLPYYEGNLAIPDAWRIGPGDLEQLRASGRRWWAVDTRYGFSPADAETTDLARAARSRVWSIDRATVWSGQESAADSTAR